MPMRLLQKKYDVTELANQDLDDLEFDDSREKNTIKKQVSNIFKTNTGDSQSRILEW